MGVYVFKCLEGPYVKVGHHLVTRGRPHAYYRVAGSGFQTIVHPAELDGKLYMRHLELLAWYPSLGRDAELTIHRSFLHGKVGEFHRQDDTDAILEHLDSLAERRPITEVQRLRAQRWGYRQIRKARKKARQ